MSVNWNEIKKRFIESADGRNPTIARLSKDYGISQDKLRNKAQAASWFRKRQQYHKQHSQIDEQKPNSHSKERIEIDWPLFDQLAFMQCTETEIAQVLGCNVNTLERRAREDFGCKLGELIESKRAGGRASLRRLQWMAATNGNIVMQIWLGKNMLNQTDRVSNTLKGDMDLNIKITGV